MMMAYGSRPGSPDRLADETVQAVRAALIQYVDAPERGERLQVALRTMAAEARAKSMLPEQLLIVLKGMWFSLPRVQAINDLSDQVRLLQRVVSICIKEYYGV